MEDLGIIIELDINIGVFRLDFAKNAVESVEIVGGNSVFEIVLGVLNLSKDIIRVENWTFFELAILVIVDPVIG